MNLDFDYVSRAGRMIRVHGNGFIQIDLEDRPNERINVFGHPAIPRQTWPTPIHDHRFGFVSTILSGCLVNVMWDDVPCSAERATHAVCSWNAPLPGSEDTKLFKTGDFVKLRLPATEVLQAGESYSVEPGELHETFANEATITHMRKTMVADIQPRVLCRIGQDPDNSFDRHRMLTETRLWKIVEDAFRLGGLCN